MALIQRKLNQIEKVDFVNKAMYNNTVYSTYKPSAFINACLYDMNTSTNITKIEDEKPADKFFPVLDDNTAWKMTECSEEKEYEGIRYRFCTYTKE